MKEKKTVKGRVIVFIRFVGISIVLICITYVIAKHVLDWHFGQWGDKLVKLEKQGKLSKEYYIWKNELEGDTLDSIVKDLVGDNDSFYIESGTPIESVKVKD